MREHAVSGGITIDELRSLVDRDLTIDNGYSVHTIRLVTDGSESLATVTIPDVLPPPGGFDVVANNHGTSGVDDACQLSNTVFGAGLAGLFGARGMIGVAVDYPGLGTPGPHPYLVARSEGASALDGLRAATALAEILGVAVSRRYAMVGLSQGGHATIAAAMMHSTYAPELDVRAFSATAPASVWVSQWSQVARETGAHHVFFSMAFHTWATYYDWSDLQVFSSSVAQRIEEVAMTTCGTAPDGEPTLFTELPHDPYELYDPQFLEAFSELEWAGYEEVRDAFAANALRPFPQTAPLRIYQGANDVTVPPNATAEVIDALRAGGVVVEHVIVPGGTHTDVAWGFVAFEELRTDESIV